MSPRMPFVGAIDSDRDHELLRRAFKEGLEATNWSPQQREAKRAYMLLVCPSEATRSCTFAVMYTNDQSRGLHPEWTTSVASVGGPS